MPLSRETIRTLVDVLGEDGARAGLERSYHTVKELRAFATELDAIFPPKAGRKDIVELIVSKVNQRIDKSQDQLLAMTSDDLVAYFEEVRPSKAELLAVLANLDFHPGSDAQRNLYKYAARQISESGMFERVASHT